jgi:hypothetical protein
MLLKVVLLAALDILRDLSAPTADGAGGAERWRNVLVFTDALMTLNRAA